MGWKNDPKIRDLEPYAKKHKLKAVIALCIHETGDNYEVLSYGTTAANCKAAKEINEQIFKKVADWEIHVPDELF